MLCVFVELFHNLTPIEVLDGSKRNAWSPLLASTTESNTLYSVLKATLKVTSTNFSDFNVYTVVSVNHCINRVSVVLILLNIYFNTHIFFWW